MRFTRFIANPLLKPNPANAWEERAVFNPSPIRLNNQTFLVYRAEQAEAKVFDKTLPLSTIGIAEMDNWMRVVARRQLVVPDQVFDQFGCEDPRVTFMDGKYYIFYTGLSAYPPGPDSIKVCVAVSSDLRTIEEKHVVTPFNAKAMALFPQKINGNYVAILTVDTDRPPSKIALAYFQKLEDLWDQQYWEHWYRKLDHMALSLLRSASDQVEVGAVPLLTEKGWLLIHSYISKYTSQSPQFGIEAALLDQHNPLKVLGRTSEPLMLPEYQYENVGVVPRIIFPSGAVIQNGELGLFYGAADTYACVATVAMEELMAELTRHVEPEAEIFSVGAGGLTRFAENPILRPVIEHSWENKYALNPAAVEIEGVTYVVYRAMGTDNVSVLGLAVLKDGLHVDERLPMPIYVPREPFEINTDKRFSGCEDPRLTRIGDTLYLCYTAYDGVNPTHVAISSISVADFVARQWKWSKPVIVSPPDKDDKNACLLPEKIEDKYILLHRFSPHIWMDTLDSLDFSQVRDLGGEILMSPREKSWDSEKIGIGAPPIKTEAGWLLIYHAISKFDKQYRLGAALLDFMGVKRVEKRLEYPILEPKAWYESSGLRPGTVFTCGAVVRDGTLYVYYGASDEYVGVATVEMKSLLKALAKSKPS